MLRVIESASGVQSGARFNKWEVLGKPFYIGKRMVAVCQCACGLVAVLDIQSLSRNLSRSCRKCVTGSVIHDRRLRKLWQGIISRCTKPKSSRYAYYGGRGIQVCSEWLESFDEFALWAYANGYGAILEIDRINNDGNYEPSNCRWVTKQANCNNRSNTRQIIAFGESKTLWEWTSDPRCVVTQRQLENRLERKWEPGRAITTPVPQLSQSRA